MISFIFCNQQQRTSQFKDEKKKLNIYEKVCVKKICVKKYMAYLGNEHSSINPA